MSFSTKLLPTLTAAFVGGALMVCAESALADPFVPAFRTYAAVGSDTTDPVWNGLTNGSGATISNIASYDAFGTATIKTKAAGATFNRPAGSGNGVRALSAVHDPAYTSHDYDGVALTHNEVDFARSSSGPSTGSGLTYLPFARDAVSVVFVATTGLTSLSLTADEIKEIYTGVDPAPGTADQVTTTGSGASDTVKINGVAVQPKIPQQGSGTRSFFLSAAGITGSLAGYISDPATGGLQDNDGSVLTAPGDLIPFSAAAWIAQSNGKALGVVANRAIATLVVSGSAQAPTTGTVPNLRPGPAFGPKTADGNYVPLVAGANPFARDTYNVVPTAFLDGTDAQLDLVAELTTDVGVDSPESKAIIRSFGLGTLSYLADTSKYRSGAYRH